MSVSCRLVARELMLPAPGSSWFGEGGENGAVGLICVHLDVVRLVRVVVKAHDREVNADENDEPSDLVSPFVHLTSCARAKWGGLVTTFTLGSSLKLIGIHHLPTRQVSNRL